MSEKVSEAIKKLIGLDKGSGQQLVNKVGNLAIEQIIKIAKEKKDQMLANDLKSAVMSVIGTCQSLGILVEGLEAKDAAKDVKAGKFDDQIKNEVTEVSPEKLSLMKEQLEGIQEELEKEKEAIKKEEEEKPAVEAAPAEGEEKKEEEEKPEEKKEEPEEEKK